MKTLWGTKQQTLDLQHGLLVSVSKLQCASRKAGAQVLSKPLVNILACCYQNLAHSISEQKACSANEKKTSVHHDAYPGIAHFPKWLNIALSTNLASARTKQVKPQRLVSPFLISLQSPWPPAGFISGI